MSSEVDIPDLPISLIPNSITRGEVALFGASTSWR
jgi:hypothetical protein